MQLSSPITVSNCFSTTALEKTLDELDDVGISFATCGSLAELQLKLAVAGKEFTQDVMSTCLLAMCYAFPMISNFLEEIIECESTRQYVINLQFFTLAYVLDVTHKTHECKRFHACFANWNFKHKTVQSEYLHGNDLMKDIICEIAKKSPLMPFHFYNANKNFLHLLDMDFVLMLEKYAQDLATKDSKYKSVLTAFESSLSAQRNLSQFLR